MAELLGCATGDGGPHAAICSQLRRLLLDDVDTGWLLQVVPSRAGVDAGDGVRICGTAAPGTVLACYPGVAYAVEDLPVMHKIVLPGNSYVVARRDGVLLDARPDGPSAQVLATARMRDAAKGMLPPPANARSFAIAHKVNHPPHGTMPNVLLFPFDLNQDEHTELHPHLGTAPFRPAAEGDPVKQTAVLIAARTITDEELFLDYKLRADGPIESWYHPVAAQSAHSQ